MKVGDQHIHYIKGVAGGDEDIGFARACGERARLRRCFQRAQAGGAHRHHAPAAGSGCTDRIDCGLWNRVSLAVHGVVGNVVDPHRLKGAGAHVQSHLRCAYPLRAQGTQHGVIKMQAGGWRGDRTRLVRVYGLIARLIVSRGRVLNIGRQRQQADLVQHIQHRTGKAQPSQVVLPRHHFHYRVVGQANLRPRLGRVARADERQRFAIIDDPFNQQLELAARILVAEQARLDHARIVHHQQIIGAQ